jgi:hypothetical protein
MISRRNSCPWGWADGRTSLLPSEVFCPRLFSFFSPSNTAPVIGIQPRFAEAIIEELELRTSIDGMKERRVTTLADPDLFYFPFLYMAGKYEFDPFTPQERETLKRFLTYGGFLFAEDTVGAKGYGFDQAFRREMKQVLPDEELRRLPTDHSVYQSFYLIEIGGRQRINPIWRGLPSTPDPGHLFSKRSLRAWSNKLAGGSMSVPGGEPRERFQDGINLIVYSSRRTTKRT